MNQCLPQLVRDFVNTPIAQIAAGWHHSLALSVRGDLYAAGHGEWGQLGVGKSDTTTGFVHVSALGGKNVKRIFAGGDSSWAVLDGTNPDIPNYTPPSPLPAMSSSRIGFGLSNPINSPSNQILSPSDSANPSKFFASPTKIEDKLIFGEFFGSNRDLSSGSDCKYSANAIVRLQVTYTDLGLCHRFAKFVVKESNAGRVEEEVQGFVEDLKATESGVVFQRLQTDGDIVNAETKVVEAQGKSKLGQHYTLYMVVDPTKNEPPIVPVEKGEMKEDDKDLIGTIVPISSETIEFEKGMSGKLSAWVKQFHKALTPICNDHPLYFELRPIIFKE